MIKYFASSDIHGDFGQEKQDNLRHIITVGHYFVGITLNVFGLFLINIYCFYGISFWIFVGGSGLFVILIIF
jgi:hypothetical protein